MSNNRAQNGDLSARVKLKSENGAILVELALILPGLLLVSMGIIEFGWAFYSKAVVTNATREGARYAVTVDATDDLIKQRVQDYLVNSLLTNVPTIQINPQVSSNPKQPPSGTVVTVTVLYQYSQLIPLIRTDAWMLSYSAAMRRE